MNWKFLFDLDRLIGKIEVGLLSSILMGILMLFSLQTVLRNVFSTALLWIDPLVLNSLLWIMMLGGSLATLDQRHMSIDLTGKLLSVKQRHLVAIVTSSVAALVVWFMASAAVDFIVLMKASDALESAHLPIPQAISKMIIPVGFYLIFARFVLRALEHILTLAGVDVGLPPELDEFDVLKH
ncbi:TRAP transporter small permease subunit [Deltaproteobacteria bacterium TL4]